MQTTDRWTTWGVVSWRVSSARWTMRGFPTTPVSAPASAPTWSGRCETCSCTHRMAVRSLTGCPYRAGHRRRPDRTLRARSSSRTPPHLDASVDHPALQAQLRKGRRAAGDRAVAKPEPRPMPRTRDDAVNTGEQYLAALEVDGLGVALVNGRGVGHRGPVGGTGLPRIVVDHEATTEDKLAAYVRRGGADAEPGEAEQPAGTPPPRGSSGQRTQLEGEPGGVDQAVEQAEAPLAAIADRPVSGAGRGGRDGRRTSRGRQGDGAAVVTDRVEHRYGRPEADGQIAEDRVQRVSEPAAVEDVHHRPLVADRLQQRSDALAEAFEPPHLLEETERPR